MNGELPISFEQWQNLHAVVNRSLQGVPGALSQADAAALKALLDADDWFGPVKQAAFQVSASEGVVHCALIGVQYGVTHAVVPIQMTPVMAEQMAVQLDEAATFARMNLTWNPDTLGGTA